MKTLVFLCFVALANSAPGGLEKYSSLVRADPSPTIAAPPRRGVRITYLGTNAYLFEARGATLLVDPYFSRQNLFRMAFKLRPVPRNELITQWLRGHPKIDAILVTHAHVDHLYDAPQILRQTGAVLIASPTGVKLVESLGVPAGQTRAVLPGPARVSVKNAVIRVLPAQHDRLFGAVPFDGPLKRLPPQKIDDWVTGVPLAFLIEMGGKRIFINSGGRADDEVSADWRPVDLAILGVAARDSIRSVPPILRQLRPRYILPSHQDDFFRPLERGFVFLPLTDFPAVRAAASASSSELILLDYFRPWTLR